MRYRNILFDLDGTLTDSRPGIFNGLRHALAHMGREVPEADLMHFIGPPLRESFAVFCGMDQAEAEQATAAYRAYYGRQGVFENAVYEGIPELLEELENRGARLVIATSKPEPTALTVLEHFGLRRFFAFVGAAEWNGPRSGKAEVIAHTLNAVGIHPGDAVMIGDRRHDVQSARAAGLYAVGAAYGYGGREELERAGADAVADDVPALRRLLLHAA